MILNRQRTERVAKRPLEKFLSRVKRELGLRKTEVTVCLVSDAEIARMNRAFRKKKGATDVLSFPAQERSGPARRARRPAEARQSDRHDFLGDIAISPSTARRNAARFERTFPNEMRVLILHGVLHLLGYDHEADQGEMDQIEARLRKRLGLE